ncbi:unnamed protein product [Dibothriocephalus latus]|uniref:G-protein coupled receptors family 1 profile domain-containing protein n=1 Tax=Dibothriocephalus latus TaxID=60516 RepID=A0A3P6TDV7_DIBLA|nr:unnamed protein product [Dibothriocephalus latus]
MSNHQLPQKSTVDVRRTLKMTTDNSHCSAAYSYTTALDICAILLNIFGCFANFPVTVLLFLLRSKKSEGLILLRVLSAGCLDFSLISLIEKVVGLNPNTGNIYIDGLICLLWSSRFLFWYISFQIYHSLFYFACNRAYELLQIRNYPIITEKQRLTAYMLLVFIGSFIGAVPHLLLAFPLSNNCACDPLPDNFGILSVLYAQAFLWIAILGIIYPAILVYICIALVLRLRNSERGIIADELEELYFLKPRLFPTSTTITSTPAPPVASSSSDSERNRVGVLERPGNKSVPHAWSASCCIVPLTAAFIVGIAFESTQQLLSAAGVINYRLRTPAEKFSLVLGSLFTVLVPLILFFHIPAMRALIFAAIASIKEKIGKSKSADTSDLP